MKRHIPKLIFMLLAIAMFLLGGCITIRYCGHDERSKIFCPQDRTGKEHSGFDTMFDHKIIFPDSILSIGPYIIENPQYLDKGPYIRLDTTSTIQGGFSQDPRWPTSGGLKYQDGLILQDPVLTIGKHIIEKHQ